MVSHEPRSQPRLVHQAPPPRTGGRLDPVRPPPHPVIQGYAGSYESGFQLLERHESADAEVAVRSTSWHSVIEQALEAYEDVDAVVRASEHNDLGRPVARLVPLGALKGPERTGTGLNRPPSTLGRASARCPGAHCACGPVLTFPGGVACFPGGVAWHRHRQQISRGERPRPRLRKGVHEAVAEILASCHDETVGKVLI